MSHHNILSNTIKATLLFCILNLPITTSAQNTKIACVGNSITYGAGVANRVKNAYPVQLQALLGADYKVGNFGLNGATLLKNGDYPYFESTEYRDLLAFEADIIYIMLGTNDSKLQNRIHLESDFLTDYKDMIYSLRSRNQDVRIVLVLPLPSFLQDSISIWNPIIGKQIIPLVKLLAYEEKCDLIDMNQLFVDAEGMFPDKIHPSSLGAERMARRIYEDVSLQISDEKESYRVPINAEVAESSFHGFTLMDIKNGDISTKVVFPKRVAKGKPWVLRARFFGHEPQTDIALLERGFHIAYCDVSNLFGNKLAVERWNGFYGEMVNQGFSEKVVLEGMSRGGLIIYNWAAENPEKVACVYADAPVLDGASWPGGKGDGKGSPSDWKKFLEDYNLDSESSITNFQGNPINKIKQIAEGGYPMLHVCGEADKVVPVDENTRPFEKGIKASGGKIDVVYKKGIGHHPHSLKNPTLIVDFILRATGRKVNYATMSLPGAEYRSGAGWVEGKGWWYQMEDIDDLCINTKEIDLLLLGNSITQGWGGGRRFTTSTPGEKAAENHFDDLIFIGAGISGDRIEHINWRIENGSYNANQPEWVTLAIGVNNFPFNSAGEIIDGLLSTIELGKKTFPDSEIIFFGPLPTGLDPSSERRLKYNKIHEGLSHLSDNPDIIYINAIEYFSDTDGFLEGDLYSTDGIHLKAGGYDVWGKMIREIMASE